MGLNTWVILHDILSSADFFITKTSMAPSAFNSLGPDKVRHLVRPDIGSNCL